MTKIDRKNMKVFGSLAGPNQIGKFGSLAAGAPTYTSDPEAIQELGNYLTGWFGAVLGANSPAIEDLNAITYLFAYQLAYLLQSGIPEWNAGTTYYKGNAVNDGSGGTFVSITDGNTGNPLTDLVNWRPLTSGLREKVNNLASIFVNSWEVETKAVDYCQSIVWAPELDLFVIATRFTGVFYTSPDGVTWTPRNHGINNDFLRICWAPGINLFVAVPYLIRNEGQEIVTSPDGITWTARSVASSSPWFDICWSPQVNLFVGTGNAGIVTSSDGVTWSVDTSNGPWRTVCWSPELGKFVALGTEKAMVSTDGVNWTIHSLPSGYSAQKICWAAELKIFVAVDNSKVLTSPDGVEWSLWSAPAQYWQDVAWSPELGVFAASCLDTGSGVKKIMTSFNGIDWVLRDGGVGIEAGFYGVCWSSKYNMFVSPADGSGINRLIYSRRIP